MADTQAYPPWLTLSTSILTDENGVPTATSATVLYLPLTYYGPSIPLDSDWTYGGLTSPASTSTTISVPLTTSTLAPPTTLTSSPPATPTTLTTLTTSIPATPTASSSVSSSTATSSSSVPTSSSTTSPVPPPPAVGRNLSKGQLVGVIIASILGVIFLLVLALSLFLFLKNRRARRRRRTTPPFSLTAPLDADYLVVDREPGEGSPRHSGEEADPFLQPPGGPSAVLDPEMGASRPSRGAVTRVPPPPMPPSGSLSSSGSGNSSSTGSGYGTVLPVPTLGRGNFTDRRILSADEIRKMDEETRYNNDVVVSRATAEYSPLMPPPRLIDPASVALADHDFTPLPHPPSFKSRASVNSRRSSYPIDAEESVTLLTAKRVRAEDLAPRSNHSAHIPYDFGGFGGRHASGSTGGGHQGSWIGKGFNWFKGMDPRNIDSLASRKTNSSRAQSPSYRSSQYDTAHSQVMTESRPPSRAVGLGMAGMERPMSSVSGKTASTVYHDAHSSMPGTPLLTPPPRAMAPPESAWPVVPPVPHGVFEKESTHSPPAYYDERPLIALDATPSSTKTSAGIPTTHITTTKPSTHTLNSGITRVNTTSQNDMSFDDILDTPAPSALIPPMFSTSITSASTSTLNHTFSASSLGSGGRSFPSGLGLNHSLSIGGMIEAMMPTKSGGGVDRSRSRSFGLLSQNSESGATDGSAGISIDILEEEPPSAGEGWKSLAGAMGGNGGMDEGRRTTFGQPQYVHPPSQFHPSEQASLYSMPSFISPTSSRFAPSVPASSPTHSAHGPRELSINSGSVGSGQHSHSRSTTSGMSLALTGSLSSRHPLGQISPSLSAFGHREASSGSTSARISAGAWDEASRGEVSPTGIVPPPPARSPVIGTPPLAHFASGNGALRREGSSEPTSPVSPTMRFLEMNAAPWAGGLDQDWNAA